MNLQDAIEQYAAMVIVGANAIQRLAEKEPGQTNPRFLEMLDELIDQAERLKAGSSDTSHG